MVIQDATALAEIQQNWAGVEALHERLQVSAFASVGIIAGTFPFTLANAAHNLPFIHAYAVLNDALKQIADEDVFKCKSIFLGELLKKSEKVLMWKDFALISVGVDRRGQKRGQDSLIGPGALIQRSALAEGARVYPV